MGLIDCNLVLKGGVTSGLVHAGAVPELAGGYRFCGIAGSSAGAIAAAFTAAAEFARSRGDPAGFERLSRRSAELPTRLMDLFQPSPGLAPLKRALVHLAPGTGRARIVAALLCFWPAELAGFAAGVLAWALLNGGAGPVQQVIGGAILGLGGAAAALGAEAVRLGRRIVRHNFGVCSGMSRDGRPALTDWLHASLQDIAFGPSGDAPPLTFGDLSAGGIDLRIVATNLATGRAEITPDLGQTFGFRPAEWARLFPRTVVRALAPGDEGPVSPIPAAADLPVLVAVRMSLACPGLMEAVPAVAAGGAQAWYADGGLTTNFPFALFDGDPRPTLALDLDTLHPGEADARPVRPFDPADDPAPPDLTRLRGFVWSLLVALREGHLRAAARAPERTARIYQARLRPDEGGMKLDMTPGEAAALMRRGADLGGLILLAERKAAR